MLSLVKTLCRWYWTVRGLMNSRVLISGLDSPSLASRATWASWVVRTALASSARVPAAPHRAPPAPGSCPPVPPRPAGQARRTRCAGPQALGRVFATAVGGHLRAPLQPDAPEDKSPDHKARPTQQTLVSRSDPRPWRSANARSPSATRNRIRKDVFTPFLPHVDVVLRSPSFACSVRWRPLQSTALAQGRWPRLFGLRRALPATTRRTAWVAIPGTPSGRTPAAMQRLSRRRSRPRRRRAQRPAPVHLRPDPPVNGNSPGSPSLSSRSSHVSWRRDITGGGHRDRTPRHCFASPGCASPLRRLGRRSGRVCLPAGGRCGDGRCRWQMMAARFRSAPG
jgi:hypothetical protein